VNKALGLIFILFFILNCSLDKKSGFWSKDETVKFEKDLIINELFKNEEAFKNELNPNTSIELSEKFKNDSFINNLKNNNNRINYKGNLEKVSRFKFAKIDNFDQFELEIVFEKDNIIFFNNRGSILKFDKFSKLIWKQNVYLKSEKKIKPILSFANNTNTLLVVDNLAKYYSLNLKTGEILWSKTNSAPFNSQVKIYKDKFFAVDFNNILRCYSIFNGEEIWSVKTDTTFIKSQKKLSIVIHENKVLFNNSIGDISSVDVNTGSLIWQTPTQSSAIYESAFLLKISDLVIDNESVFFSNNKNEFFSLDQKSGILNWQQKVNSNLRPTIIDNLIFTVTNEGFLIVIEKQTGKIIRITNIFDQIKKKKRSKITPVGFIMGNENIYLTTDNGLLILIDIKSGKSTSILKIDNNKISRPAISKNNLFIIKDNGIIKLN
jgi:outer membrane protein assembly factor BamB